MGQEQTEIAVFDTLAEYVNSLYASTSVNAEVGSSRSEDDYFATINLIYRLVSPELGHLIGSNWVLQSS